MRALVQRVRHARVEVDGVTLINAEIGQGLLVLLGVGRGDTDQDAQWLVRKIVHLRVFSCVEGDEGDGKMNFSLLDIGGACLVVSQFTLYGDCSKGRRPFFGTAEDPQNAERLFNVFKQDMARQGAKVASGEFGAAMQVHSCNDGPVTLWLDSNA